MGLIHKGAKTWQSPGVTSGFRGLNQGCSCSVAHHGLQL